MTKVLLIAEKPAAARKIAYAISESSPKVKKEKGVSFLEGKRGDLTLLVVSAVGHLFALEEKEKKGWRYPVFDIEWAPTYKVKKEASYTKKYLDLIKKLAKEADRFILACDYDIEGEVIGFNVLRFACGAEDAQRMKFSTLTKADLIRSFNNLEPHLNYNLANAGIARHMLDWLYGINLSRALSLAIRKAGMSKVMSIGRVQGPTLRIVAEREKEIITFKPESYWEIFFNGIINGQTLKAKHILGAISEKEKAEQIFRKVHAQDAIVSSIVQKEEKKQPPAPFDLTTLQTEAYRLFRYSPQKTLNLAENLYLGGYISYPRTSSQKLPPSIGYKKIIVKLSSSERYADGCAKILKKEKLFPRQGKKDDPAHPAIYPTGIIPKKLNQAEEKLYDLVVKRFLACFGDPVVEINTKVELSLNGELFLSSGKAIREEGWFGLYQPYVNEKISSLPHLNKGDVVKHQKTWIEEKETQPPKRYTQSSLLKELEKKGLGTKATRALIIETLLKRGYIVGKDALVCTPFGLKTVEVLKKQCDEIVSVELTRHFETELDQIMKGEKKVEEVIEEAKTTLTKILDKFKSRESEIGKELLKAYREAEKQANLVGPCPVCEKGNLVIKSGKYGKFIACDRYPECKATFPLPSNVLVETTTKLCESCNHPMIKIIRKGQKSRLICINPDCPSKKENDNSSHQKEVEKRCPKCGRPLVLRKGLYGEFYGCSGFPECDYTEPINSNVSKARDSTLNNSTLNKNKKIQRRKMQKNKEKLGKDKN